MRGRCPIYAIGVSRVRDRVQREAGLAALGRVARRTGGFFIDAGATDPSAAYATLRARIQAVTRIRIDCPTCTADGNRYRLRIALNDAGLTLSDGMDVRLYPETAAEPPAPASDPDPSPAPTASETPAETVATPPDAGIDPASSFPAEPVAAASVEQPTAPATAPPDGPQAWLVAWWPYLAGGGVVLMLGVWLTLRSRAGVESETAPAVPPVAPEMMPAPDPAPSRAPLPARPSAPTPSGPAIRLTFMNGRRRGESVRLVLAPALIGRAANCALVLPDDDEVSACHARLSLAGKGAILEDLGSTNGTVLNGVPLSAPHPVRDGDVVRIGQTEWRLGGIEAG